MKNNIYSLLLVFILYTVSGLPFISAQTFPCDGQFYLCQSDGPGNTAMKRINFNGGNVSFDHLGNLPLTINGIGFNPDDNYIYGFERNTKEVVRIKSDISYEKIGVAPGFQNFQSITGAFTNDGLYIVHDYTTHRLYFYEINPSLSLAYSVELYWAAGEPLNGTYTHVIPDFAVDPKDPFRLLMHEQNTDGSGNPPSVKGHLLEIDIDPSSGTFGAVSRIGYIDESIILQFGSLFFGNDGLLYGYGSQTEPLQQKNLIAVNPQNADADYIAMGPESKNSDGCSCPLNLKFTKSLENVKKVCDTIIATYFFSVTNESFYDISGLSFSDQLPMNGKFSGIMLGSSIFGSTDYMLSSDSSLLTVNGIDINSNETLTFEVVVNYPAQIGEFSNQAFIAGLPSFVGNELPSDDPSTTALQDPTNFLINELIEGGESFIDTSICENEYLIINDSIYENPGTYQQVLENASSNGCDSIINIELSTWPVATGYINESICSGSTYNFNGKLLTYPGTYFDTLNSFIGCDSIVVLDLSIRSPIINEIEQTICSGGSYSFAGQMINEPGIYDDTLTSAENCDSIIRLNLSVLPPDSSAINAEICAGSTFDFNGALIDSAGIYNDTLQNSSGCDSIVHLNLNVIPAEVRSMDIQICSGKKYIFNGKLLDVAGTYYDTLSNSMGCDSLIQLQLSISSPTITNENISICTGSSYDFNGKVIESEGRYYDTLRTVDGCDSIISLDITFTPAAVSTENIEICQGSNYIFNGRPISTSGIYNDTVSTPAGCDSIVTVDLSVVPPPTTPINKNICSGSDYNFNGIILNSAGTYYDTVSNDKGCDSIIELNLTLSEAIETTISDKICRGSYYTFNGNRYYDSGTYLDTIFTPEGCDSIVTLELTYAPTLQEEIHVDLCSGKAYNFNGLNIKEGGVYIDTLKTIEGCDSIIELNLTISPPEKEIQYANICWGETYDFYGETLDDAGTYIDTQYTNEGCAYIIQLELHEYPQLSVHSPEFIEVDNCSQIQIDLMPNFTADSIIWSPSDGLSCTNCNSPIVENPQNQTYTVRLFHDSGCFIDHTISITPPEGAGNEVFIPNTFTPKNQDGINDHFTLYGNSCIQLIEEFRIFDRWGELVYEDYNIPHSIPSLGWDGNMNTHTGVYVYYFKVRNYDGTTTEYYGDVTLH